MGRSYKQSPIPSVIKDLGRKVKLLRKKQGMTQEDLANHSGLSLTPIKYLESGKNISLDKFLKILRSLGRISEMEDVLPDEIISPRDIVFQKHRKNK